MLIENFRPGLMARARALASTTCGERTLGSSPARSRPSATTRPATPAPARATTSSCRRCRGLMSVTGEPGGEPDEGRGRAARRGDRAARDGRHPRRARRSRAHRRGAPRERVAVRRERRRHGEPGGEPPDRRHRALGARHRAPQHRALPGVPRQSIARSSSPPATTGCSSARARSSATRSGPTTNGSRRTRRVSRTADELCPCSPSVRDATARETGSPRSSDAAVPCSPIRTMDEVFDSPRVRRSSTRSTTRPEAVRCGWCANPLRFDGRRLPTRLAPPVLGADARGRARVVTAHRPTGRRISGSPRRGRATWSRGPSRAEILDAAPESPFGFPAELFIRRADRAADDEVRADAHHCDGGRRRSTAAARCSTWAPGAGRPASRSPPAAPGSSRSTVRPRCSRPSSVAAAAARAAGDDDRGALARRGAARRPRPTLPCAATWPTTLPISTRSSSP